MRARAFTIDTLGECSYQPAVPRNLRTQYPVKAVSSTPSRIAPREIPQEAPGVDLPIGFGPGLDQRGAEHLRFLAVPEDRVSVMRTAQDVAHRSRRDRTPIQGFMPLKFDPTCQTWIDPPKRALPGLAISAQETGSAHRKKPTRRTRAPHKTRSTRRRCKFKVAGAKNPGQALSAHVRRDNSIPESQDGFQCPDGGFPVITLFGFGQLDVGHKAGMLLEGIITTRARDQPSARRCRAQRS